VEAEFFNAKGRTGGRMEDVRTDGRTDGQSERHTDMTKLIVGFRNFASAPKTYLSTVILRLITS
jgi:hypothetical protein